MNLGLFIKFGGVASLGSTSKHFLKSFLSGKFFRYTVACAMQISMERYDVDSNVVAKHSLYTDKFLS